jgi:hypothetical protein
MLDVSILHQQSNLRNTYCTTYFLLFITDQQNKRTLKDLQNDHNIGPIMIVQNDVMNSPKMSKKHGDNDIYYVLNGILVASMSDASFIGTGVTVSLFAQNV